MTKLAYFLMTVFILTNQVSCKSQKTKVKEQNNFFEQIQKLDEFKQETKRVDSIKKVFKIPVEVSIQIIDSSFLTEDKGKNISLAFITEQYPHDNKIMYTIKFDKDKQKIISVDKDKKQFENSDFAKPDDIVLPNKKNN